MMVYALSLVVFIALVQAIYSWRLAVALRRVPQLEEQLSRLTRSITLLVDTTEGCFEAVSSQLTRPDETPARKTASRQGRQRRIVGASRRGRTVQEIAVEESVPESEVALRVAMARELNGELTD